MSGTSNVREDNLLDVTSGAFTTASRDLHGGDVKADMRGYIQKIDPENPPRTGHTQDVHSGMQMSSCWQSVMWDAPSFLETTVLIHQDVIERAYSYDDVLRFCNNLAKVGIIVRAACPSTDLLRPFEALKSNVPPLPIKRCNYCSYGSKVVGHIDAYCTYLGQLLRNEAQRNEELKVVHKRGFKPVYAFNFITAENKPTALRMGIHLIRFFAEPAHYRIPALFNKYMAEEGEGLPHNKLLAAAQTTCINPRHSFGRPPAFGSMTQEQWNKQVLAGKVGVDSVDYNLFTIPNTRYTLRKPTAAEQRYYVAVNKDGLVEHEEASRIVTDLRPRIANLKGDLTYVQVCEAWQEAEDKMGVRGNDANRTLVWIKKPKDVAEAVKA